ncbi:MAG: hypothetical protein JETT_0748 [Candidatus Jettenia ecosi]|uniref:Uncharacterized protein n=1 Tax=Candidatus Jettenia ecosi TaxID=2494326 RepID=A0A533QQS0_9BACT|nr:MAG: hypothetical protein JETT_0748 [Candidatus Jettenia ecosi]
MPAPPYKIWPQQTQDLQSAVVFARQPCYRVLMRDLGQWLCAPSF